MQENRYLENQMCDCCGSKQIPYHTDQITEITLTCAPISELPSNKITKLNTKLWSYTRTT